ncbi:tetratricopeptide repeat protein [candidate division GN15 bacterium]|nr:tetratricopeptide repeat protein [candidate division GN15 bacterium]
MDQDRYQKIQQLFEAALELSGDEREAFVDRIVADDAELGAEVRSLLAADSEADSLLDQPVADSLNLVKAMTEEGKRIGPYRLVSHLGAGGMGTVYVAERIDGHFRREVALKLIKLGMDSEHILQRFQAERQILAQLDHPNIARLLDGGLTDDGRPYFTMEYVKGEPIDRYCRSRELSVEERLRLFETVCATVQYAQENLIVHRDLKPSNILVTEDGQVKLLDFGVAKVLGVSMPYDVPSDLTRTGFRVMTPSYASPEQIRGERVTTASDVYSLGVVLFELLTGRKPFDLANKSAGEIEEEVQNTAPPRPSAVVDDDHVEPSDTHTARALRRRLRGDLDNICLMALRKEPARRYRTAEQLRADIQRHLDNRPIHARPSSFGYKARKFIERNRAGLTAMAAMLIVAASLVAFYTVRLAEERDLARREADKAEQVTDFLIGLFEIADPNMTGGEEVTARELLVEGSERIETELADQPEIQANLLSVIGNVYYEMGLLAASDSMLTLAVERQLALTGENHPDYASYVNMLAVSKQELGDYEGAEVLYRRAIDLMAEIHGPNSLDHASVLTNLASLLRGQGRYKECEPMLREALTIRRQLLGNDHIDVAHSLNHLGRLLTVRGDLEDAKPLLLEALAIRESAVGELNAETVASLGSVGGLYRSLGQRDSSIYYYRRAIASATTLFGEDHHYVGGLTNSLGHVLREDRQFDEAEKLFRRSLGILERMLPEGHANLAYPKVGLGLVLSQTGRATDGERYLREAVAVREAGLGVDHYMTAIANNSLGYNLYKQQRYSEARGRLERSFNVFDTTFGQEHGTTQQAAARLDSLWRAIETGGLP